MPIPLREPPRAPERLQLICSGANCPKLSGSDLFGSEIFICPDPNKNLFIFSSSADHPHRIPQDLPGFMPDPYPENISAVVFFLPDLSGSLTLPVRGNIRSLFRPGNTFPADPDQQHIEFSYYNVDLALSHFLYFAMRRNEKDNCPQKNFFWLSSKAIQADFRPFERFRCFVVRPSSADNGAPCGCNVAAVGCPAQSLRLDPAGSEGRHTSAA